MRIKRKDILFKIKGMISSYWTSKYLVKQKGDFFKVLLLLLLSVNFLNSRPQIVKNDTLKSVAQEYIGFNEVDIPPVIEECSQWEEDCELRNCFDLSVIKVVKNNVKEGFEKEAKYVSTPLKVAIVFVVDTTGVVKNIRVSGDDKILNRYAESAIIKLSNDPKIQPAEHNGKFVEVLYEIKLVAKPLKKQKNYKSFSLQRDFGQDYEEVEFDRYVIHPDCRETGKSKKDSRCLKGKIVKFVNNQFDTEIGKRLNLNGIYTIYVRFKISRCGNVIGVQSRGPHPSLEEEAIRVVKMLPKMKPASVDGENVNVAFSLPIKFRVQ